MFEQNTPCSCGHTAGQHRVEWTGAGLGYARCKANRCRCQMMGPAEVADEHVATPAQVTATTPEPEVTDPEPAVATTPDPQAVTEPVETGRQRVERITTGVLLDHLPGVAAVLEAARAWVAAIRDDPRTWADREDLALIDAVRALDGSTLPPYAPAVPPPLAEYGAHHCSVCRFLGQPDGHTGCGGELERVTVAILRSTR